MNFDELIGMQVCRAKDILVKNGYTNINIVNNYKSDEKCNELLVCLAKQTNDLVTLVCGNFFIIKD
jgi:hypothetical protein